MIKSGRLPRAPTQSSEKNRRSGKQRKTSVLKVAEVFSAPRGPLPRSLTGRIPVVQRVLVRVWRCARGCAQNPASPSATSTPQPPKCELKLLESQADDAFWQEARFRQRDGYKEKTEWLPSRLSMMIGLEASYSLHPFVCAYQLSIPC